MFNIAKTKSGDIELEHHSTASLYELTDSNTGKSLHFDYWEIEHLIAVVKVLMNSRVPQKTCTITNGKYCWILEVDGKVVPFNGGDNAEYFEEHYRGLGYEIVKKDEYNS